MKISVLTPDTVKWPVRIVIPSGHGSTQNLKMTGGFRLQTGDQPRAPAARRFAKMNAPAAI